MDQDDIKLIQECQKHGIPVIKRNGQMYTHNTLIKKLKTATSGKMRGGAKGQLNDLADMDTIPNADVHMSDMFISQDEQEELDQLDQLDQAAEQEVLDQVAEQEEQLTKHKASRTTKTKGSKKGSTSTSKKSIGKKSIGKISNELLENPLGPKLEFHVDYQMQPGQAILEDPLIQAYFNRLGISKIDDDSEIPVGLAMAVYGNHAQLADSGLSKSLPNVLENMDLKKYWDSKGITKVTPQTNIPVKFLYLI